MLEGIFAQLTDGSIGHNNSLIWTDNKYKELTSIDMKFFREQTIGKNIVLGYNTWQSLNYKKLPGRKKHYIITSRTPDTDFDADIQYLSLGDFKGIFKQNPTEIFVVIGGVMLYKELLPMCSTIYQTVLDIPELTANGPYDSIINLYNIINKNNYNIINIKNINATVGNLNIFKYTSYTLDQKEKI